MNKSFAVSLLVVAGLILVLQIPILLISGLRADREQSLYEASTEVAQKWGDPQSIIGPVLVVPFLQRGSEKLNSGEIGERSRIVKATFLPSQLEVAGNLASEIRSRGIFEIPVYRMELDFGGAFDPLDFREWGVAPDDILWERAYLSVQVSDPKAIQEEARQSREDSLRV